MNLLDVLKTANGGRNLQALADQFGLSGDQADSVVSRLVPFLAQGLQSNVSQEGGLENLLGALAGGNHSQYLDDPSTLAQPEATDEGNGILGHILGGKDVSRSVASQVAGSTGISDTLIKQMLPVVASMAMGALAKNQQSPQGGLAGMLDFNHDGSAVDDVIGIVGKLFNR